MGKRGVVMGTVIVGRAKKPKTEKREFRFDGPSISAFIKDQCRTERRKRVFFKNIGLSYNEKGEPVVVPR